MTIKKRITFTLFLMVFVMYGCVTTDNTVKTTGEKPSIEKELSNNTITTIDIEDYKINITAGENFEYTAGKPTDPFKVLVEMKGIVPGKYGGRLVSDKKGISEIILKEKKVPEESTLIEIILTSPLEVSHSMTGNVLTINIHTPESIKKREKDERKENESKQSPQDDNDSDDLEPQADKEALPPATEIVGVSFKREGDMLQVLINGNGYMKPDVFPIDDKIIVDIPDVKIKTSLPEEVALPLRGMRWADYREKVRIILELQEKTTHSIASIDDSVVVSLSNSDSEAAPETASNEYVQDQSDPDIISVEPQKSEKEEPEDEEITSPQELKYSGKKISLDFQDADIVPIFRLLTDVSGYNMVIDPKVEGKITLKLFNVPWDQALDIILKTHSLGMTIEGNIIRILPMEMLEREEQMKRKAQEAAENAEPLVTKVFSISYANVEDVKKFIDDAKIISTRGKTSFDQRTGSLIVKDVASVMPELERLIKRLDRATPQVLIEARIVEVNEDQSRQLGVDWGFFSKSYDRRTGAGATLGGLTGDSFLPNFPSVVSSPGTGITLGFINSMRTFGLDLRLSALESTGNGKVISNPRILTLNNQTAKITQGRDIPYPQIDTASGQISAAFKDVSVSIDVTPQITPNSSILMDVNIKKEDLISFTSIGGSDTPVTSKLESDTKVLIGNGETLVIGGMFKKDKREGESGYPLLKDIPVVGSAFKTQTKDVLTSEVMIFITPRIVDRKRFE